MKISQKMFAATALLAMSFTAPAMATMAMAPVSTCTSTTTWTNLGSTGSQNFGHSFGAAGSYSDCYSFTLPTGADATGTTLENNLLFDRLFIDVSSVNLFSGSTIGSSSIALRSDSTPDGFAFANLSAGTYTMQVMSTVYNSLGLYTSPVSYTGNIRTVSRSTTAVPEPGTIAMLAIGMLGLFAAIRRRRA